MATLKADPEYRRRILLLSFACVAIAFGVVLWGPRLLDEHIDGYVKTRDFSGGIRFLQISAAVLFVPTLPMVYYLYRFARRIQTSGQFPPPGTKVLRDTVVIEGSLARQRGNQLLMVSILLAVMSLVGMIYLPYLFGKIGEGVGRKQESNTRFSRPATPAAELKR
jgi:hypothetical protein